MVISLEPQFSTPVKDLGDEMGVENLVGDNQNSTQNSWLLEKDQILLRQFSFENEIDRLIETAESGLLRQISNEQPRLSSNFLAHTKASENAKGLNLKTEWPTTFGPPKSVPLTETSKVFSGVTFSVEFESAATLGEKQFLKSLITDSGGTISYIVANKCYVHIVPSAEAAKESRKVGIAKKKSIPVVTPDFIFDCVDDKALLDPVQYEIGGVKDKFFTGTIPISKLQKEVSTRNPAEKLRERRRIVVKLSECQEIGEDLFGDNFFVLKWNCFKTVTGQSFGMVEAQESELNGIRLFRLATYRLVKNRMEGISYIHVESVEALASVFLQMTERLLQGSQRVWAPPLGLGSGKASLEAEDREMDPYTVEELKDFLEQIWAEALGEINSYLSQPVESVKINQLDQAESFLTEIKNLLRDSTKENLEQPALLSQKFSSALNLRETDLFISGMKQVSTFFDLIQIIRDVVSMSEATNWNTRCTTEAKLRALRCHIEPMHPSEYEPLLRVIGDSMEDLRIHKIYRVGRGVEQSVFEKTLGNEALLFHGSKPGNLVGILSRGLLLPQAVIQERGVERTDIGHLGNGIYFSNHFHVANQYCMPGSTRSRRFMVVSQVARGRVYPTARREYHLTKAPAGYDCVQAIPSDPELQTEFEDSEFAIYRSSQQKLQYLIEYNCGSDDQSKIDAPIQSETFGVTNSDVAMEEAPQTDRVQLSGVKSLDKPINKLQAGLQSTGNKSLPLTGLHIRANLVDLSAEVTVVQVYSNPNNETMEAKYVFPLDEGAAVCGFEAYINDKHVVGRVEEKEQAKKEYREAVQKGHGAYLMEEEAPNVFTVSVGNLPPQCTVVIKIRYVAELSFEKEELSFRLPSAVAPWVKRKAVETSGDTQVVTQTIEIDAGAPSSTSLLIGISMPFDIRGIKCPTHPVKIKKTATQAVVELVKNVPLNDNFHLLVALAEVHVPRLWIETPPDSTTLAAMLVFYPEFDAPAETCVELVILVDLSNSMRGEAATRAKTNAILLLDLLLESGFTVLFNVIIFGTGSKDLFVDAQTLTKSTFETAFAFLENAEPTMGNTELHRVIQGIGLKQHNFQTNCILFSDGHFNNLAAVFTELKKTKQIRLFTFQCSDMADTHALQLLARQSGGAFDNLDAQRKSTWKDKLLAQFEKAKQPGLENVKVDFAVDAQTLECVRVAPQVMSSMFSGERKVVYAILLKGIQNLRARLTATVGGVEVSTTVAASDTGASHGKALHRLAAKALIRDWDYENLAEDAVTNEVLKRKTQNGIVELSKEHSVVCSLTSFVAVEERGEGEVLSQTRPKIQEILREEDVDFLSYLGWDVDPTRRQQNVHEEIDQLLRTTEVVMLTSLTTAEDNVHRLTELTRNLSNTDPQKLKTTLLTCQMLISKGDTETAVDQAMSCFDDAVAELDTLDEESYAGSTEILQQLRDITAADRTVEDDSRSSSGSESESESSDEEEPQLLPIHEDFGFMNQLASHRSVAPGSGRGSRKSSSSDDHDLFGSEDDEVKERFLVKRAWLKPTPAPAPKSRAEEMAELVSEEEYEDMGYGLFDNDMLVSSARRLLKPALESWSPKPKPRRGAKLESEEKDEDMVGSWDDDQFMAADIGIVEERDREWGREWSMSGSRERRVAEQRKEDISLDVATERLEIAPPVPKRAMEKKSPVSWRAMEGPELMESRSSPAQRRHRKFIREVPGGQGAGSLEWSAAVSVEDTSTPRSQSSSPTSPSHDPASPVCAGISSSYTPVSHALKSVEASPRKVQAKDMTARKSWVSKRKKRFSIVERFQQDSCAISFDHEETPTQTEQLIPQGIIRDGLADPSQQMKFFVPSPSSGGVERHRAHAAYDKALPAFEKTKMGIMESAMAPPPPPPPEKEEAACVQSVQSRGRRSQSQSHGISVKQSRGRRYPTPRFQARSDSLTPEATVQSEGWGVPPPQVHSTVVPSVPTPQSFSLGTAGFGRAAPQIMEHYPTRTPPPPVVKDKYRAMKMPYQYVPSLSGRGSIGARYPMQTFPAASEHFAPTPTAQSGGWGLPPPLGPPEFQQASASLQSFSFGTTGFGRAAPPERMGGSLFGAPGTGSGFSFGAPAPAPPPGTTSLFGGTVQARSGDGGLFGVAPSQARSMVMRPATSQVPQSSSLFGSALSSSGGLFGAPLESDGRMTTLGQTAPPATTTAPGSGGLFGALPESHGWMGQPYASETSVWSVECAGVDLDAEWSLRQRAAHGGMMSGRVRRDDLGEIELDKSATHLQDIWWNAEKKCYEGRGVEDREAHSPPPMDIPATSHPIPAPRSTNRLARATTRAAHGGGMSRRIRHDDLGEIELDKCATLLQDIHKNYKSGKSAMLAITVGDFGVNPSIISLKMLESGVKTMGEKAFWEIEAVIAFLLVLNHMAGVCSITVTEASSDVQWVREIIQELKRKFSSNAALQSVLTEVEEALTALIGSYSGVCYQLEWGRNWREFMERLRNG